MREETFEMENELRTLRDMVANKEIDNKNLEYLIE